MDHKHQAPSTELEKNPSLKKRWINSRTLVGSSKFFEVMSFRNFKHSSSRWTMISSTSSLFLRAVSQKSGIPFGAVADNMNFKNIVLIPPKKKKMTVFSYGLCHLHIYALKENTSKRWSNLRCTWCRRFFLPCPGRSPSVEGRGFCWVDRLSQDSTEGWWGKGGLEGSCWVDRVHWLNDLLYCHGISSKKNSFEYGTDFFHVFLTVADFVIFGPSNRWETKGICCRFF